MYACTCIYALSLQLLKLSISSLRFPRQLECNDNLFYKNSMRGSTFSLILSFAIPRGFELSGESQGSSVGGITVSSIIARMERETNLLEDLTALQRDTSSPSATFSDRSTASGSQVRKCSFAPDVN